MEPQTAEAPETPPPGTVSGPKSCLIAAGVSLLLGFGSIVAAKIFIERRNADIIAAAEDLAATIDRAASAPGAASLRPGVCQESAVLTPADLQSIARPLAASGVRNRKAPAEVEQAVPPENVVVCATKSNEPPACEAVARAYASAAAPAAPFTVTVQHPSGERCAERFDAAAAPLGSTASPNVPLLIDPR